MGYTTLSDFNDMFAIALSGRRVNDGVGELIGRECVRRLTDPTVLGITFKENLPDIRIRR